MEQSFHFYSRFLTDLNAVLGSYVTDTASNVIGAITPVTTTLLTIYVVLWGWSMMRGMIQEPIMDGATRMAKLAVIVGMALSIGNYSGYISDFLWNSPDQLAAYVASGQSGGTGNVQFLDTLMSQMYDLGLAFWDKGNGSMGVLPDFGLLITAFAIWTAGLALTAYGAFLLILSKVSLAILLGIGPLFVVLLIFEGTKKHFESWMNQALNFVFLVALTAAAIKLILSVLQNYLLQNSAAGLTGEPGVRQAIPAVAIAVIGVLVLMQLPSIASALGGGTAIGTMGAASLAFNKAKGGAVAMRPTNLKRGINKAKADVRIAGNAARAAAGAPGAVYRKVTSSRANRVSRTGT
jgi:type IV secretion system protein VirB6